VAGRNVAATGWFLASGNAAPEDLDTLQIPEPPIGASHPGAIL
jgi:hypothetical protein